jgi:thiosulfate/3-mercaptopyruvate sulfurtransferase
VSNANFPNSNLLVSPEWLEGHLDDADIRIVEVTPPGAGYSFAHIRGAVFFDPERALAGSNIDPAILAGQLGELGIAPDKKIVIYDEIGGVRATQMFWLLEYLGFERVAILEGGVERWLAEGYSQTRVKPTITAAPFTPAVRAERSAAADQLAARLHDEQLVIIDCRTAEEFTQGHIPGARQRDWDKTLTLRAYQAFRDEEDLTREFGELGARDGREIVTYCGSGQRSSHTYFTLRLMGYPNVRNYKGSWDEWQKRTDLPQEK